MLRKNFLLITCIISVLILFTIRNQGLFSINISNKKNDNLNEFNLFTTAIYKEDNPEVYLIDLSGKNFKSWKNLKDIGISNIEYSKLDKEKNLYILSQDLKLSKLDFEGNLIWSTKGRFHHDLTFSKNQKYIYSLLRNKKHLKSRGRPLYILEEFIVKLNAKDGEIVEKIPLFLAYQKFIPEQKLSEVNLKKRKKFVNTEKDILHNNSIAIYNCSEISICKEGEVALISSANISTISFFHLNRKRVIWSYGNGQIQRQHHASYIRNDKIILFDNGIKREKSRAIMLDIKSKKIIWQYPKKLTKHLYSYQIGGVQYLKNGNFQITFGTMGLVKEVNLSGETVWEFNNYAGRTVENKLKYYIYRMERYNNSYFNSPLINYRESKK